MMMKIKKFLFSSLRTKLLVMFILLTVVPLILVGVVSYSKAVAIITENAHANAQLKSTQLSQDIDGIIQDTMRFAEIGKHESTVRFLMDIDNDETYNDAKTILNLFPFYREIIPSSKYVIDINIMSNKQKGISEKEGVFYREEPLSTYNNQHGIPHNITNSLITLKKEEGNGVISITHPIIWDITYEVIGHITIFLHPSIIDRTLNDTAKTTDSFLIYSEHHKEILFTKNVTNELDIEEIIAVTKAKKNDRLYNSLFIVSDTSAVTGWMVIGIVPESLLMKEANDIRNLIIGTVACSIIFTISLYYYISSMLIRPIRNLMDKMKIASKGNLDVKINKISHDEIAELGDSFNIMIHKIKSLLEKSIREEKQLKFAELRTLQAQINPHFLYNTLDTIIWMAEAKKGKDVIEITKALSHFFRLTLSQGRDVITIAQEIEHIKNYLVIQQTRYRDILELNIEVSEELNEYSILKITLQPLVENAIYHGIKNKRGKGLLQIKGGFTIEGYIQFKIIDNGIGMNEETLSKVKYHLYNGFPIESQSGGFGMYNVQERINLYYGEPFGLTIESSYQNGTTVCLTLPALR
ncbi:sensor histidine kinase [Alkalihalobacterium bogoriense]|uniref:sensor histidine kinase n=1 Tax=Alkalihalobacterium bogoriense TaxID=246272 RepID=UPI000686C479|nr:sensor histidine kinase [Alkalihalobacterium bogoriense]